MILISHPRSGSEWFMQSLTDYTYPRFEILSLYDTANIPEMAKLQTLGQKLKYLKTCACQKIHGVDIKRDMRYIGGNAMFTYLRGRSDLYFLERRNKQQAMTSLFIGVVNDFDFHSSKPLTKSKAMTKAEFLKLKKTVFTSTVWARTAFNYAEMFIYEDLLEGQRPKTLSFDPSIVKTEKRNSHKRLHLIENIDEVRQWMGEHKIPGHV